MPEIFDDIAWAWRMLKARRFRRNVTFKTRMRFDAGLQHMVRPPSRAPFTVSYPDAFYEVTAEDLERARNAAQLQRVAA